MMLANLALCLAAAAPFTSPLLISVPSDRQVLYADSADPQKVQILKAVTARPLQWSESGWTPLP